MGRKGREGRKRVGWEGGGRMEEGGRQTGRERVSMMIWNLHPRYKQLNNRKEGTTMMKPQGAGN
jgi:hypothetical protein